MGTSNTIAAQYARAGIRCQTTGHFHVKLRSCRPESKENGYRPMVHGPPLTLRNLAVAKVPLRVEAHPADHGNGRGRGEPAPLGHTLPTPSVESRIGPVRVLNYFWTTASA